MNKFKNKHLKLFIILPNIYKAIFFFEHSRRLHLFK